MAIPQAPVDNSGGFMLVQYSNGTDVHRMRLHVLPFSRSEFVISGTPETYGADDGHHSYAYSPHTPAGAEMGINDTFAAICNLLKPYYTNAWTFTLAALYQNVGNVLGEVFPTPTPTAVTGTSVSALLTTQSRAMERMFNFKTALGGKARLALLGPYGYGTDSPTTVTGSSGGSASDQALVAYLSGNNTAIVGHDGQKLSNSARVTSTLNKRLRRKYNFL